MLFWIAQSVSKCFLCTHFLCKVLCQCILGQLWHFETEYSFCCTLATSAMQLLSASVLSCSPMNDQVLCNNRPHQMAWQLWHHLPQNASMRDWQMRTELSMAIFVTWNMVIMCHMKKLVHFWDSCCQLHETIALLCVWCMTVHEFRHWQFKICCGTNNPGPEKALFFDTCLFWFHPFSIPKSHHSISNVLVSKTTFIIKSLAHSSALALSLLANNTSKEAMTIDNDRLAESKNNWWVWPTVLWWCAAIWCSPEEHCFAKGFDQQTSLAESNGNNSKWASFISMTFFQHKLSHNLARQEAKMTQHVSPNKFVVAVQMFGMTPKQKTGNRIGSNIATLFCGVVGVLPWDCTLIWHCGRWPHEPKPKHTLWGSFPLKRHNTEHALLSMLKTNQTTFQKWALIAIKMIAKLSGMFASVDFLMSTVLQGHISFVSHSFFVLFWRSDGTITFKTHKERLILSQQMEQIAPSNSHKTLTLNGVLTSLKVQDCTANAHCPQSQQINGGAWRNQSKWILVMAVSSTLNAGQTFGNLGMKQNKNVPSRWFFVSISKHWCGSNKNVDSQCCGMTICQCRHQWQAQCVEHLTFKKKNVVSWHGWGWNMDQCTTTATLHPASKEHVRVLQSSTIKAHSINFVRPVNLFHLFRCCTWWLKMWLKIVFVDDHNHACSGRCGKKQAQLDQCQMHFTVTVWIFGSVHFNAKQWQMPFLSVWRKCRSKLKVHNAFHSFCNTLDQKFGSVCVMPPHWNHKPGCQGTRNQKHFALRKWNVSNKTIWHQNSARSVSWDWVKICSAKMKKECWAAIILVLKNDTNWTQIQNWEWVSNWNHEGVKTWITEAHQNSFLMT